MDDPQRQAIAQAMYRDRRMVVIGGWFITALAAAMLLITIVVRGPGSPWQLAAWLLALGTMLVLAILLHRAGPANLYRATQFWISLIHLIIAGQLTNFYFGVERALILNGTSPVLMLCIPVAIIGARAMLKPLDATRLNLALLGVLAVMTTVHALLYWDQASTRYAMLLMLATVFIAGPLCELLLRQHFRLQFSAEQSLRTALTEARREIHEAERRNLLDPVTGLVNRQGIRAALETALVENKRTGLAQFSISNLETLREKQASLDSLLQQAAIELQEAAGPEFRLGRMDGGDFHLWGPTREEPADWEERCQLIAKGASNSLREHGSPISLSWGAGVYPRGHDSAFALEDVSFRCFMNSVRD